MTHRIRVPPGRSPEAFATRRFSVAFSLIVVAGVLGSRQAHATCKIETINNVYTVTCTGDQYTKAASFTPSPPGKKTTVSVENLTTSSLSATSIPALRVPATGSAGSGYGQVGEGISDRTIVFAPNVPGYSITQSSSSTTTLRLFSKGGRGGGKSPGEPPLLVDDGDGLSTTNVHGGRGGQGGSVNYSTFTLEGVDITAQAASGIYVVQQAGDGGAGGDISAKATKQQRPYGGDGGSGGFGGGALVDLTDLTISRTVVSSNTVPTILIQSQGGSGGKGGQGRQPNFGGASAHGGKGGDGGRSNVLRVSLEDVTAINTGTRVAGIVATSRGGTGGNGGTGAAVNSTYTATAPGEGGKGGMGGFSGPLTFNTEGALTVHTIGGDAVRVESIGGDGGTGGEGQGNLGSSKGGDGGQGGGGGAVTLNLGTQVDIQVSAPANLEANPIDADSVVTGVVSRSLGGAGGSGGKATGGTSSKGGNASGPGPASTVDVFGGGDVVISGGQHYSLGVLAQSIGGFAGNGGSASGTAIVAYGGDSNSGGDGRKVTLDWAPGGNGTGLISTDGDHAEGVVLQSVGGGGGKGGSIGGSGNIYSSGGDGSAAGNGGATEFRLRQNVTVQTQGEYSTAAMVQSIGGGGGTGGSAKGAVKVGGSGSGGGNGGTVLAIHQGEIKTAGENSRGLHLQSVGSGGGNTNDQSGVGISTYSVGGSTGQGGNGGRVDASNFGSVETLRNFSGGVTVESVGGGGGSSNAVTSAFVGMSITLGSDGGPGGSGGDIFYREVPIGEPAEPSGTRITTQGDSSPALTLVSQGAGGGSAGASAAGAAGVPLSFTYAAGGSGGAGGNAGNVDATLGGTYETHGIDSVGAQISAVGGGGGIGANAIAAQGSLAIGVSLGRSGAGGGGGDGGVINIDSAAEITTTRDNSIGMQLHSLAKGGGSSGTTVAAGGAPLQVTTAIGAAGGTGGQGGQITLSQSRAISTGGENAVGIEVLSSGGGGGTARKSVDGAAGTVWNTNVGGDGGKGGSGGNLILDISGDVLTLKANSDGINAQTNGEGGGTALGAVNGALAGLGGGVAIGGEGGTGGTGGDISFAHSGSLTTQGDNSTGVHLASSGGDGGSVGFTGDFDLGVADLALAIGGKTGSGGAGGDITVDLSGSIETQGQNAGGFMAKSVGKTAGKAGITLGVAVGFVPAPISIGGSGGNGGVAGDIVVTKTTGASGTAGDIKTAKENSIGFKASSTGGDGGDGGKAISAGAGDEGGGAVAIGGSGGAGGRSGNVTVNSAGSVTTALANSTAFIAESTAGNGGDGGMAIAAAASIKGAADVAVAVGGSGGSGGQSGRVEVSSMDTITTSGDNSHGLMASSLGGAGGRGGLSIALAADANSDSVNTQTAAVSVGRSGGAGGKAQRVEVSHAGNISTVGEASNGIVAMSTGGDGGAGGMSIAGAVEFSVSATESNQGTAVSVGGGGGDAGSSEAVTVITGSMGSIDAYEIKTGGVRSTAIYAASTGGDGGTAGMAISGSLSARNVGVSVGGGGGDAGNSGKVTVTNYAKVTSMGEQSPAIQAFSAGGAGGTGGIAYTGEASVTVPQNSPGSSNIAVAVGGGGGAGGQAGEILVTNAGTINTGDADSPGIQAKSQGGDGGSGGASWVGVLDYEKKGDPTAQEDLNIQVSVGGKGGGGGMGEAVTVGNTGSIITDGLNSAGVSAQSMGGSGGTGGSNHNALLFVGDVDQATKLNVEVGGDGGNGGKAGKVTVTNSGSINTGRPSSEGIFAQSIGGNGGEGGFVANLNMSFKTKLKGEEPTSAVDPILDPEATESSYKIDLNVEVGGAGGDGAIGGAVEVTNSGLIGTEQDESQGIFAQSIGGNGGDGGSASVLNVKWNGVCDVGTVAPTFDRTCFAGSNVVDAAKNKLKQFEIGAKVLIGGAGGKAAHGNTVLVRNEGQISTSGISADAIFAQSIGGGGGIGGNAGAGSLEPWVPVKEAEYVKGAIDIFNYNVLSELKPTIWDIAVGGSGGASGDGESVQVINSGNLTTTGEGAWAINASSTGGGGGQGGKGQSRKLIWQMVVDGSGSGGGQGGDITIENDGTIHTEGVNGLAIFAQSLGGGGGSAGDVQAAPAASGIFKLQRSLSPFVFKEGGGNGGAGGDISITSTGAITTIGAVSTGIFVQSAGGGGGAQGQWSADSAGLDPDADLLPWRKLGSNGGEGTSGTVSVNVQAPITVTGEGSIGIMAASVGGSVPIEDEYLDGANQIAGDVLLTIDDDVTASGSGGSAIVVQSLAGLAPVPNSDELTLKTANANGKIDIQIAEGATVSTTKSTSVDTIAILGGNSDSQVVNYGTISASSMDRNAVAVARTYNSDIGFTLTNHGTISGGLHYNNAAQITAPTANIPTFINHGLIELGNTYLDYATLINHGTVAIGAADTFDRIVVASTSAATAGKFINADTNAAGETGKLQVSVQVGDEQTIQSDSDLIDFGEVTAELAGEIDPEPIGINTVASATSGELKIAQGRNLTLTAQVRDDAVVDWGLNLKTEGDVDEVYLTYVIDTDPWEGKNTDSPTYQLNAADREQLNANLMQFGPYVDELAALRTAEITAANADAEAQQVGGAYQWVDDMTSHLLDVDNASDLIDVYETWTPQNATAPLNATLFSATRFAAHARGCPANPAAGLATEERGDSCTWLLVERTEMDRDNTGNLRGFDENSDGLYVGVQSTNEELTFGGSFGYESSSIDGGIGGDGSGDRYMLAGTLAYSIGTTTFTASLLGGIGDYRLTRQVDTLEGTVVAKGKPDISYYGAFLRGEREYRFDDERGYIRPTFGLGVIRQSQDSYTETGAGDFGARVDSVDQTKLTLHPAVEIGGDFTRGDTIWTPSVRLGGVVMVGDDESLTAALAGVPKGGPTIDIEQDIPDALGDIGLGLEVKRGKLSMRLGGATLLSDDQKSWTANASVYWTF